MTAAERLVMWVGALVLVVLGLGLALLPLETPAFTATLSQRYSLAEDAGLTKQQMKSVAETVRAFVIVGRGKLPETYQGRPAFDASAVHHLDDVRDVIAGGHVAIAVAALLAIVGAFAAWRLKRLDILGGALWRGGLLLAGSIVAVGAAAVVDFDTFFSAFHRVFFAAGTWTFPYDSLLIQLFPEEFWATGAIAWGAGCVAIGGGFALVGAVVRRRFAR